MNESLLKSLIRLFAAVVETEEGEISESAHNVISIFLKKDFSREQVDEYLASLGFIHKPNLIDTNKESGDYSLSKRVELICHEINSEFEQHQKVWLVLQLVEFIVDTGYVSESQLDFIKSIANRFNIPTEEYLNGKEFILASAPQDMPKSINVILLDGNEDQNDSEQFIYQQNFLGKLFFIHIPTTNTLMVKYFGESNVFLNSKTLKPGRSYIFGVGGVIRSPRVEPIYYSKVAGIFFQSWSKTNIRITAEDINYRHKGSSDGIHPFSFDAHSGQLIAIMGGSGVGKSTLINVLNGNLKPVGGKVFINGYNIGVEKDRVKGIIGYVPQDDLLVEDLTVFQNLYFGVRFCFSDKSKDEINSIVEETLKDFELEEARNLKVGNPINKFISGGQRKRLNIAMELIREPAILFVDEPTSGLSSFDSERIVLLLKRQTFKGKIVIANVHQPSSDIYKLFDKVLVMDQGGRIIYQGNPMDAVVYFKHEGQFLKADESECLCCGNVNTEQILRIIESRVVNEYGKLTRKRKRSASEWYEMYLNKIQVRIKPTSHLAKIPLPENSFRLPNKRKQSYLFFQRNILSRLANRQFMLIALLEAPLLALILGFFSKYFSGTLNNATAYIYSHNDNIPSFLFMSVVAALFMGLILSAEEIIRDEKVRQRERFLNLSYFSYINSKVFTLLIFSLFQTLLFVAVGHYILEVNGSFFSSWLVLFSTALCANLIGLNISAALNSIVSIYITIPLIIIPMLLMSGVVVSYNKLHKYLIHPEYVPAIADFIPLRWSYEAMCVNEFKRNKFNRHFFEIDQKLSNNTYYASFLIPRLSVRLEEISKNIYIGKATSVTISDIDLVRNELRLLSKNNSFSEVDFPDLSTFKPESISSEDIDKLRDFLEDFRNTLLDESRLISRNKDEVYQRLIEEYGSPETVFALKRKYHNNALEDLVLNRAEVEKISIYNNKLIRKYNPIHAIPTATNGRAHLFAPVKKVGSVAIDTLVFNTTVLWLMAIALYITLLTNMFRRINKYMERFKFKRLAKRIAKYIPR